MLYPTDEFLKRLLFTKTPPNLHELRLKSMKIREDLLSEVILHFKNELSALIIQDVAITNGDDWASALRKYGRELPLLRQFSIKGLKEWTEYQYRHATYPSLHDNPAVPGGDILEIIEDRHRRDVINYRGEHADKALEFIGT